MFDKEAEDKAFEKYPLPIGFTSIDFDRHIKYEEGFEDGAEFGYNKANEWHYPSKGEYPNEYEDILICFLTKGGMKECVRGWCEYYSKDNKYIFKYANILGTQYPKTVIAWKEIVFPKEIKGNDGEKNG